MSKKFVCALMSSMSASNVVGSRPHTETGWGMFRGGPYRDGSTLNWGPTHNGTAWRFLLKGRALAAPSVHPDGSMIYVGGHDGFYGVNADGTFGFFTRIASGVVNCAAAVCVKHNVVVVGGQDGVVYGFHARTGVEVWRVQTGKQQNGKPAYIFSSPVLDDRSIAYIGAADGKLYAVAVDPAATPRVHWTFDARGEPIWSSPALSGDQTMVYVGGVDNFVHAVDAVRGTKVWEFEAGGFPDDPDDPDVDSSPAVSRSDGTVYVGSFDNRLHALDGATGRAKWSYETRDDVISSPAVSRDGKHVFVSSLSGGVHCVDASKGSRVWSTNLGQPIYDEAVLDGKGTLYVGADDGKLYALDAASGRTQWVHDVGDKVRGEPAVANGRVYVSTINDDDFLHAIGTTQPAAAPVRKGGGKKSGSDKGDSFDVVPIVFAALGFLVLVLAGASVAVPAMRNRAAATRWARMMNSDDDAAPDGSSAGPFVELQDAAMREVI